MRRDRNGGVAGRAAPGGPRPDPELVERATRRRFTAEYKLAVLREADGVHATGGGPGAVAPRGPVLLASGDVAQTARRRVDQSAFAAAGA